MIENPYEIIYKRKITEKTRMLARLCEIPGKCKTPKAVFLVSLKASKQQIAQAIEQIYEKKKVRVVKVNTINVKPKVKRPRSQKAREGKTKLFKKAIVTFAEGTSIEESV